MSIYITQNICRDFVQGSQTIHALKNINIDWNFPLEQLIISEKDQNKLFEPFHRGENVGNISGTGLGLSVLEKAVALHGAKIEVESKPNEGSTFKVTFQKQ